MIRGWQKHIEVQNETRKPYSAQEYSHGERGFAVRYYSVIGRYSLSFISFRQVRCERATRATIVSITIFESTGIYMDTMKIKVFGVISC
jgi:hypothetical protein